jgi:hypothetical protein
MNEKRSIDLLEFILCKYQAEFQFYLQILSAIQEADTAKGLHRGT